MTLHKSVTAAIHDNMEVQSLLTESILKYESSVKKIKTKTADEFFNDFIKKKIELSARLKNNFMSITPPPDYAQKALVASCYYGSLVLFPDEAIKKRMMDFGFPRNLKFFTPLEDLLLELDGLQALGYRIKRFYAVTCAEQIIFVQSLYEAGKLGGLSGDYRKLVTTQSRRRKPTEIDTLVKLTGDTEMAVLLKTTYDSLGSTFGLEGNDFVRYQKKVSAGDTPPMLFKNLQNSIQNDEVKKNEYYRYLVNLTKLLTKKVPHTEEYFLDNLKTKNYPTYLSTWVKRQWLKKN